jgi:hypothetical protein
LKRFVLYYRGKGAVPDAQKACIESIPTLRIVDHEQERLWLVEAQEKELRTAVAKLPDWTIAEERSVDLP